MIPGDAPGLTVPARLLTLPLMVLEPVSTPPANMSSVVPARFTVPPPPRVPPATVSGAPLKVDVPRRFYVPPFTVNPESLPREDRLVTPLTDE